MSKEITTDKEQIAYCGLYCGACGKLLEGKCPGCRKNDKASWCKIRTCNQENHYHTCAECSMQDVNECKKFNNFMSKFFALFFKSNRKACVCRIREIGEEQFAEEMAKQRTMTIKK